MLKFDRVVALSAIGVIGLASLVGCSGQKATSEQPAPAPSTAETSPMASPASAAATGFDGLNTVITNTKTAVEAGDFAKAKTEFDQFETYWSQVEDGVKAKSGDTYDAIEKNMDEIGGELKASAPNKDKVLASLQSIQTNVTSAAK